MKVNSSEIEDPGKGKLKYLRPFIVLLPTFIVCVFNIYANIPFFESMIRIIISILFFYIIGSIAQMIIRKLMIDAQVRILSGDDEDDEEAENEVEDGDSSEDKQRE